MPERTGNYKKCLQEFMEWANIKGMRLGENNEVDDALVRFMNDRYLAGLQAHLGKRLMGALMSEAPEFSKVGRRTAALRVCNLPCFVALSSSMSLITVIPQGPLESNGRKHLSLSSCSHCYRSWETSPLKVRFGPRRWPARLPHTKKSNFLSSTYGGDWRLCVDMALAS